MSEPELSANGEPWGEKVTANQEQIDRYFHELVVNIVSSRQDIIRELSSKHRDIDAECDYPKSPGIDDYIELYRRDPVARRVVECMPLECSQVQQEVYEDEDARITTNFERAWDDLGHQLRGEDSWYDDEEYSPIWDYVTRLDIASKIGQYGVAFLAIDDGLPLNQPARRFAAKGVPKRKLRYIRVFPEHLAQISRFETSPTSPRYGYPLMYLLSFNDPREQLSGAGVPMSTMEVHWTRIVHVADTSTSSNEVFATPEMESVLNPILDCRKLRGGSAEMYWQGAFPGLSFETHPSLGGDVILNRTGLRQAYSDYLKGLQRALMTTGMAVKSIAPQVVDPTPQIRAQIEAICIAKGIPMRIFLGSERGELASDQDQRAWNNRVRRRHRHYIIPRITIPLIDRLIWLGVLPIPASGRYKVSCPDIDSQSPAEKAQVANQLVTAMSTYIKGGVQHVLPPLDMYIRVLGFSKQEAEAILANVEKVLRGDTKIGPGESTLVSLPEGLKGMLELFKLAQAGGLSEEQLKQQLMFFFKIDEKKAQELIADGIEPPQMVGPDGKPIPGQPKNPGVIVPGIKEEPKEEPKSEAEGGEGE